MDIEIRKLQRKGFPAALLQIPAPPANLWIRGKLPSPVPGQVYLCVVGSRLSTSYGREACRKIISGLSGYPIVIVSGFAIGIDAYAHKCALEAGLPTVAFPGSGLSDEVLYPKNNTRLKEEILKAGGYFLSEHEPDFLATQWSFPERNRLMAAMAKATLVIEAAERSGTLITARLTLEYNRDLLAVPGPIFSPAYAGTNKLLRQGAGAITCAEDLLEALGFERPGEDEKREKILADLSPEEKVVVEILREPLSRDELIRRLNLGVSRANILLSTMEIREIITEEMGEIRLR